MSLTERHLMVPGVLGWAPAAGQEEFLGMELLEVVTAVNIP